MTSLPRTIGAHLVHSFRPTESLSVDTPLARFLAVDACCCLIINFHSSLALSASFVGLIYLRQGHPYYVSGVTCGKILLFMHLSPITRLAVLFKIT